MTNDLEEKRFVCFYAGLINAFCHEISKKLNRISGVQVQITFQIICTPNPMRADPIILLTQRITFAFNRFFIRCETKDFNKSVPKTVRRTEVKNAVSFALEYSFRLTILITLSQNSKTAGLKMFSKKPCSINLA